MVCGRQGSVSAVCDRRAACSARYATHVHHPTHWQLTSQLLALLGGFAMMDPKFTVQRLPASTKLPSASTCFHLLKVPDYAATPGVDVKVKLRLAVMEGTTGFAFS